MKLRPLFILLLFVVSTGILVWIYYAATHERQEATASPWADTLSDLDACSRHKHVKSVQYDHFAQIAGKESHTDAARLFRAMALSERVQEGNCANAILRLGGTYTPPGKVVVFRGTTQSNLERSVAYELQAQKELQGMDVRRALGHGNRYAARVLVWASAGDLQHVILMQRCRHAEKDTTIMADGYAVCPVCGNMYATDLHDAHCPYCLTGEEKFIRFE